MKNKNPNFYHLDHGWANKYYWFEIIEDFPPGQGDFINRIKKNQLTFTKQKGTTPADIHGSTLALMFFSEKFVKFLNKNRIKGFKAFKIKFSKELEKIGKFYYIELKNHIPCINRFNTTTYILEDWKGQELFSLKGTKFMIASEKLANIIKNENFKNLILERIQYKNKKYYAYKFEKILKNDEKKPQILSEK